MAEDVQPDPSLIGGVPTPPLAFLPEPVKLFQTRARRFAFLAESNALAPYLTFLAALSKLQARLAVTLPPVTAPSSARVAEAARVAMPLIDRLALVDDPGLSATLDALLEGAVEISMPDPARLALDAVRTAEDGDRRWLLANILSDQVPEDSAAPISSLQPRCGRTWRGSPRRSMRKRLSLSDLASVPPAAAGRQRRRSSARRAPRTCAMQPAPAAPRNGTRCG